MKIKALTAKEIGLIALLCVITLFIFIPEIMTFKKGFLGGDYGQQFFSYSKWYSENIKRFVMPFYTSLAGCGYSLGAEGQTGIFYPFNIILFLIMPVVAAYQLSVILHFILGGIFSYIFIRNKNISVISSLIFALVFMFGANICGIRYNTVVQKVLAWLPLSLFLIDKFFSSQNRKILIGLGFVFLLQIFAGFIQIAFYCIAFSLAYFLTKLLYQKGIPKAKTLFSIASVLAVIGLISLVQIVPTMRMVQSSTRAGQDIGFSLWGSSTPFVLSTLIFPHWDSLVEGNMYMGLALIPFLILFLRYFKKSPPDFKIYFWFSITCFILALGSFTPVLPMLIKVFHLGFIRKPSKFLFIGNFFLTCCAVWALDYFSNIKEKKERIFIIRTWALSVLAIACIFVTVNFVVQQYGSSIVQWGNDYVARHIFGRPHHQYSLDVYHEKVRSFFNMIKNFISIKDPRTLTSFLFMGLTFVMLFFKKKLKALALIIVFTELFIFAQYATGLKGNFLSWKEFLAKPEFISYLEDDKSEYRIYNFFTKESEKHFYDGRSSIIENKNIIYGISSVGIYAPIIDKDYHLLLADMGAVDDSLGRAYADRKKLIDNMGLLSFLNVKYIISYEDLDDIRGLAKVYSDEKMKIYKIAGSMPRIFFANTVRAGAAKEEVVELIKKPSYDPSRFVFVSGADGAPSDTDFPADPDIETMGSRGDYAAARCEVDRRSFLVRSECAAGWSAYIDGKRTKIYTVNAAFQGIVVPEGKHYIEFKYDPYYTKKGV